MLIFDPDLNDFREPRHGFNSKSTLPMYGQTGSFGVFVAIGTRQIGTGKVRVLGEEDYPFYSMNLPLYRLVVIDILTGTKGKTEYLVTRDSPYIYLNPLNGKNYNINNAAFEPATSEGTYYLIARGNYPQIGLVGFAVRNKDNHTDKLPAIPNESPDRNSKNIAKEIMLHVGGNYTKTDGTKTIAGSYGCFGIYEGNSKMLAFEKDIVKRQDFLKSEKQGHWIEFFISQRPNVKWKWVIDKNGKIVG